MKNKTITFILVLLAFLSICEFSFADGCHIPETRKILPNIPIQRALVKYRHQTQTLPALRHVRRLAYHAGALAKGDGVNLSGEALAPVRRPPRRDYGGWKEGNRYRYVDISPTPPIYIISLQFGNN